MNMLISGFLLALMLEVCVWLRHAESRALGSREFHCKRFLGLCGVGICGGLLGVCACVLMLRERRDNGEFKDMAFQVGLNTMGEKCCRSLESDRMVDRYMETPRGLILSKRDERGNGYVVLVSRNPVGVYLEKGK